MKSQNFEEAARLRDMEKKLLSDLEIAKREWEMKAQDTIHEVTEEHMADVVAMMTGIPVNKIAESESAKLLKMEEVLKEQVVGQDEAIDEAHQGHPPHARRPEGPEAAHRIVHLPRPHRRRQDRTGQGHWRATCSTRMMR